MMSLGDGSVSGSGSGSGSGSASGPSPPEVVIPLIVEDRDSRLMWASLVYLTAPPHDNQAHWKKVRRSAVVVCDTFASYMRTMHPGSLSTLGCTSRSFRRRLYGVYWTMWRRHLRNYYVGIGIDRHLRDWTIDPVPSALDPYDTWGRRLARHALPHQATTRTCFLCWERLRPQPWDIVAYSHRRWIERQIDRACGIVQHDDDTYIHFYQAILFRRRMFQVTRRPRSIAHMRLRSRLLKNARKRYREHDDRYRGVLHEMQQRQRPCTHPSCTAMVFCLPLSDRSRPYHPFCRHHRRWRDVCGVDAIVRPSSIALLRYAPPPLQPPSESLSELPSDPHGNAPRSLYTGPEMIV